MELPFDPLVAAWFNDRIGIPTPVQQGVWPLAASGAHVLATAPTGTGKTLAAFLTALDRLLTGRWPAGSLRVLYISPLKALNNDIRRNLLTPLAELRERWSSAGRTPPEIEVLVRSGDSPDSERRQLKRRPPEILITTPESLNILLTQPLGASLFAGLQLVILDEVHALVGSKRGTALFTALERLVDVAGEVQRIGLSATVNPPDLVARALGGFAVTGEARAVELVAIPSSKAYDVSVVVPAVQPDPNDTGKVFWEGLALELRRRVRDTNSTLVFTNSRRACEKLARLMNENQDALVAYPHHGSLSKELRHEVEDRLKRGDLRAVVATNSLELGIDIGDLDEVVLAETPRTAASAIQKVGRAGHRTAAVSRALLYPSHGIDLVEAAVIVRCIREQAVEPLVIPEAPLDVLAQTLLSVLCVRPASADELYALVRRAYPYRTLSRRLFDLVLQMLAGRYEGTRIAELKPRIEAVGTELGSEVWKAKPAVPFLLYSSGGTIPDRGVYALRDSRTGSTIGDLDEEFVWERQLGDRFALGAQVWKIASIDDQAVQVEPVDSPPHIIPFWRAEDQDRAWFLAQRVGLFLAEADRALERSDEGWKVALTQVDGFSPEAAQRLWQTLERQRSATGGLPHRWRLVVEKVVPDQRRERRTDADQFVIHTFWGARLNKPWAFALAQAWEEKYGYALETYAGDDQVLVLVPPDIDLLEALELVTPENLEGLLRQRLEATGAFGARFREGAGRALLLPKPGFDRRTPLWQTRLRSKRLFGAVSRFPEFPILLEAWRQCLKDEFDLPELKARLAERALGSLETVVCQTSTPSPFSDGLLWKQVNELLYAGDEPPARGVSSVEDSLWKELLAEERPRLPLSLVDDWEARWGRTAPGYAPETAADLADFLEVRIALSAAEWEGLTEACRRDAEGAEWIDSVPTVAEGPRIGVAAIAELWSEPEPLWLRWLEGRGPIALEAMAEFWGQSKPTVEAWATRLSAEGTLVVGQLTEGTELQVCLTATWDQLVRRLRANRRLLAPRRPAVELPYAVAHWQGLVSRASPERLEAVVGRLVGLPLQAELWESAVLPTRTEPYRSADFDRLFIEGGLRWFGAGSQRVVLGFPEDRASFPVEPATEADLEAIDRLFSVPEVDVPFADLASRSGWSTAVVTETLWRLAWKGLVSAVSFGPVRAGIKSDFRFDLGTESARTAPRGFQRWSSARAQAGVWRRWAAPHRHQSSVEELEEAKRRARLVLDRYGVVFRALLVNESPAFQWRALFPALRLMEFSGEVIGGVFYEGVPGLQFSTPEALAQPCTPSKALWVQHAQDPSSLCGLGLEAVGPLPRRTMGTWLWWKGADLVGTVTASGRRLTLQGELTGNELTGLVKRMAELLLGGGRTHWALETVDDRPAATHPKQTELVAAGFRPHGDKLLYWRTP